MKLSIDEYLDLNTPLHKWEPKTKFIGIMLLVFTFSFVDNIYATIPMILLSTIFFLLSRLPFSYLLVRWLPPAVFLIVMSLLFLFYAEGTVWFTIGSLAIKTEGARQAYLMITRFLCIITLIAVLFGSTSFLNIIKAMRSLGLPQIMADMTMFAYRYIFEIMADLIKMQTSMKTRGFKGKNIKDLYCFVSLVGTILIRSYEQSGRIYEAMILKGYGQNIGLKEEFKAGRKDKMLLGITIIVAALLMIMQMIIG